MLSEKRAHGMLREQVPDDPAIALRGDDLVGPQMAEGLRDGGVVDSGGRREVRDADRPGGVDTGQQGEPGGISQYAEALGPGTD